MRKLNQKKEYKMKKKIFGMIALLLAGIAYASDGEIRSKGFAVFSEDGIFKPLEFERRPLGDNDILIETLYAGICHSDVHHAFGDWRKESYPMVPGHEIAGRVAQVGKNVSKFKVGDYAGVGCLVNSCGECEFCKNNVEQFCQKRVLTYACPDIFHGGKNTMGGYSNNIVVSENFAIKIPQNAQMEKVAPLLCAGITTYSPIRFSNVKKGGKVGIAGFGGLGHMGVQYAVKLGADVCVFDITEEKREDAMRIGAKRYVNINNPEDLKGLEGSFDFILSTIPAQYDPMMYVKMLKMGGELAIVGIPANKNCPSINIASLVFQANRKVYGSQIGGIKETQEMVDYSVKNEIYPEVETIKADQDAITQAYKNVIEGKVKFRYVIDMKTLK